MADFYKPPPIDDDSIAVGKVITCTVLEEAPKAQGGGYIVDIGTSQPARVPRREAALQPNATGFRGAGQRSRSVGTGWAPLPPGAVFEALVLGKDEASVNVSIARAQRAVAWKRVHQLAQLDVSLEATVLRFDDAGATLAVEDLPAFCPWSHWQLPREKRDPSLLGTSLPIKFLEVDQVRARLVVSNRRVIVERALSAVQPGALVRGTISALKEYGAVVALDADATGGGDVRLEGLLHVSQVSQHFVRSMDSVFAVGEEVHCVVIKVSPEDGSLALSTKMLEAKPGEMIKDKVAVFERARVQAAEQAAAVR